MPSTLGTVASHRVATTIPMTGLVAWHDAADAATIIASGGAVSQWNDKSGAGNNVTQGTAANQPITSSFTMNGRNVIRFDGTRQLTRANTQVVNPTTGEWTGIVAFRFVATGGAQNLVDGDDGFTQRAGQFLRIDSGSPLIVVFNSTGGLNTESPGGSASAGTSAILSAVVTPTTVESWLNQSSNGSTALSGSRYVGLSPYAIGASAGAVQGFNGDIAEVIFYNRALSTVERQQVESYLKAKWMPPPSIPLTIPWDSAFWASDPSWMPPANGAAMGTWRNAGASAVDANPAYGNITYQAARADLNNKPTVLFQNGLMDAPFPPIAQPNHVFVVASLDNNNVYNAGIFDALNGQHLLRDRGTGGSMMMHAGASIEVADAGRTGPFAMFALYNQAASTCRVNGVDYPVSGSVGTNAFGTMRMGGHPGDGAFWGGISFIGIKDTALTAQEISDLEAWAKTYYGVPIAEPPAMLVNESFDGAAGTPITSLGTWVQVGTSAIPTLDGAGNVGGPWVGLAHHTTPLPNNYWIEVDWAYLVSQFSIDTFLRFALPTLSADFRQGSYTMLFGNRREGGTPETPGVDIQRWIGGATSGSFPGYAPAPFTVGGEYTVRLENRSGAMTVDVNGVEVLSWTDPAPLVGQFFGFQIQSDDPPNVPIRAIRAGAL